MGAGRSARKIASLAWKRPGVQKIEIFPFSRKIPAGPPQFRKKNEIDYVKIIRIMIV